MNISPIRPQDVDQLLDSRVAQAQSRLENQFLDMNPMNHSDWIGVMNGKADLINAVFAQQQNFLIQHHLAKTILSTT